MGRRQHCVGGAEGGGGWVVVMKSVGMRVQGRGGVGVEVAVKVLLYSC